MSMSGRARERPATMQSCGANVEPHAALGGCRALGVHANMRAGDPQGARGSSTRAREGACVRAARRLIVSSREYEVFQKTLQGQRIPSHERNSTGELFRGTDAVTALQHLPGRCCLFWLPPCQYIALERMPRCYCNWNIDGRRASTGIRPILLPVAWACVFNYFTLAARYGLVSTLPLSAFPDEHPSPQNDTCTEKLAS